MLKSLCISYFVQPAIS